MVEEQQKSEVVTFFLVGWRSSKISEENIRKKVYLRRTNPSNNRSEKKTSIQHVLSTKKRKSEKNSLNKNK